MGLVMNVQTEILADLQPHQLAKMAMENTDGSRAAGTEWIIKWLSENPNWLNAHLSDVCRDWASNQVGLQLNKSRHVSIFGNVRKDKKPTLVQSRPLKTAIEGEYSRFMDFPLHGTGKKIGDATPAEVRESAEKFALSGRSIMRRARWQFAVADAALKNATSGTDCIRESLSEATLYNLWEESNAA